MSEPCKLCGKVAWYQVPKPKGTEYFCGEHRDVAVELCKAEIKKYDKPWNQ